MKLDGNRVAALHGLSRVLSESLILENHVEALKFARRAAGLSNDNDPEVLLTLAQCLVKSGQEEEADEVVKRALTLPKVRAIPGLARKLEEVRER